MSISQIEYLLFIPQFHRQTTVTDNVRHRDDQYGFSQITQLSNIPYDDDYIDIDFKNKLNHIITNNSRNVENDKLLYLSDKTL